MYKAREPIGDTVKQFLASNPSSSSGRADVVFRDVFVEGSGRGVSIHENPSLKADSSFLTSKRQVQAAPTVWTTIASWSHIVNPRAYRQREPSRTLLHGFSGTLGAGEMLLVIGKPGSGCTTFLKALANMREEYKDTTGTFTYRGRPAADSDVDRVKLTFCGMFLG